MHSRLAPKNNIFLIIVWLTVAAASALFESSLTWIFWPYGLLFGVAGGLVQSAALRESSPLFAQTETWGDVRKALRSSKWGRRYLWYFWIVQIVLIILAFALLRVQAFVGLLAGYSVFSLARELITLLEVKKLTQQIKNIE